MKIYSNVSDTPKKKNTLIVAKPVGSDTGATVVRENGQLKQKVGKNYAGQSDENIKKDLKFQKGNGQFNSGVAPMVGGTAKKGAGVKVSYGNSSAISKKSKLYSKLKGKS